jgi:hypothetical protein
MMTVATRLDRVDDELTPKQRMLAHVLTWRDSESPGEYARRRYVEYPNGFAARLEDLRETVKRQNRGAPRDQVDRLVRQAAQELVFLDELVNKINSRMCDHYQKFWYMGILLTYLGRDRSLPDSDIEMLVRSMADEVIGEREIVRSIQDQYFDGQQIIFQGALEHLEFAEKAWWLALRISSSVDIGREAVVAITASYHEPYVHSIVAIATAETHDFFGRDSDATRVRAQLVGEACTALSPPAAQG